MILLPEATACLFVEEYQKHLANSHLFLSLRTGEMWNTNGFQQFHATINALYKLLKVFYSRYCK